MVGHTYCGNVVCKVPICAVCIHLKGIVQQKLRRVEIGINRQVLL
jgi:hypothetical protein